MDRIAFLIGDMPVYLNSVILALGALAAACVFAGYFLEHGGEPLCAAATAALSAVLGLVLARLLHWYFRADSYDGLSDAMLNFTDGGYALAGVFLGCVLSALLARRLGLTGDLPGLLDALSVGGCGGIALGRLACFYSASDRGMLLSGVTGLPFCWPVTNTVTGRQEYRLAVFLLQAAACAVLFLVLLLYSRRRPRRGNVTLLFLLFYGLSQVLFDSMRYDSLYFRSNGFVGVDQVLGACAMVLVCAVFSVRLVKAAGFRKRFIALWAGCAALLGGAGYMEYYVQRHPDLAPYTYSIMALCLAAFAALTLLTARRSENA